MLQGVDRRFASEVAVLEHGEYGIKAAALGAVRSTGVVQGRVNEFLVAQAIAYPPDVEMFAEN